MPGMPSGCICSGFAARPAGSSRLRSRPFNPPQPVIAGCFQVSALCAAIRAPSRFAAFAAPFAAKSLSVPAATRYRNESGTDQGAPEKFALVRGRGLFELHIEKPVGVGKNLKPVLPRDRGQRDA